MYFIAIGIIGLASALLWTSRENNTLLQLIQLAVLVTSIWLIPILLGGQHRAQLSIDWREYYRQTQYITTTGHLNPILYWYHEFPTTWVVGHKVLRY